MHCHFLDHLKMLQNKVVDGVIIMCYQLVQDAVEGLFRTRETVATDTPA